MSLTARDQLIVALDCPSVDEALRLVDTLGDRVLWYKVGLELFLRGGNPVVRSLVDRSKKVFLDLKLHDIPNTVSGAVRSAALSGAELLTIHATGGSAMIAAAADAARTTENPPLILAVTVLTSMDMEQLASAGISRSPAEQVALLGSMSIKAGADGLVCSAQELTSLRSQLGPRPILVVPGIRPAGADIGDQKRVATPTSALRDGANYLVVGRPILQAANKADAAQRILDEIRAASAS